MKISSRRQFMKQTAGATAIAATGIGRATDKKRPNVIFCISDDQSWIHAGAYGDPVIKTPTFDRIAKEGVLFTHAFCSSPSCTASRGSVLTGQDFYRLEEGGSLYGRLDSKFKTYPDILEEAGYRVGVKPKAWGPGTLERTGRTRNPAGNEARDFRAFLNSVPDDQPFCYWWGTGDPHRAYELNSGKNSGMDINRVPVPEFFPDHPIVRSDIADYYFEIERYDREFGEDMKALEYSGRADNTIIIMTSDNGMPFPRCKGTLYDYGTRMPFAVRWPSQVTGGRTVDDFIGWADVAPTFLEACGVPIPEDMTGRSFVDVLTSGNSDRVDPKRDKVFTGRERHCPCRPGDVGYPARAVRTHDYLYIHNIEPNRWPAGHPDYPAFSGIPNYGDIDKSPTKSLLMAGIDSPEFKPYLDLAVAKRPEEELYDVRKDPYQLHNLADENDLRNVKQSLRKTLDDHLQRTGDPRSHGSDGGWDRQEYTGRK
jgi:N-sulfoglucosamine sulfohydrolase